jgi:hypothetical protein
MLLSKATQYLVFTVYPLQVSATGSCHFQAKIVQVEPPEFSHNSFKTGIANVFLLTDIDMLQLR